MYHLWSNRHACGVSAVVHRLDKKQNKPEWSGKGSREIKRFKASFAHEYLMPIRGGEAVILCQIIKVSQEIYLICIWPHFNSFICERTATSPSRWRVMRQLRKWKMLFSSSVNAGLFFCFFFLSSLPQRQNTITDSCFLRRVSAAPYCLSAKQILDNCLVETGHL